MGTANIGLINAQRFDVKILSARSYVQDGLVAHWDGIENADYNKHDETISYWHDLKRGIDCEWGGNGVPLWTNNCWRSTSRSYQYFIASYPNMGVNTNYTCEFVTMHNGSARGVIIGSYQIDYPGQNTGYNFEYYYDKFRTWLDASPDFSTPNETFIQDKIHYFASLKEGNKYKTINDDGVQLVGITNNNGKHLTQQTCYIGSDARTGSMCWIGNIYAIRIYDRSLSTEEIKENSLIDKIRFNLP